MQKEQGKDNMPKPGKDRLNWALGLSKEELTAEEPVILAGTTGNETIGSIKNAVVDTDTAGKAMREPKTEIKVVTEPEKRARPPLETDKKTGWNEHNDGPVHWKWPKRGLGGGDPTYDDNINRNKTIKKAAIAVGSVITAGVIVFAATASCREANKAPNLATPTTSAATGTPAPRPENIPTLVTVENNSALEVIGTPEMAVQRFGVDSFSKNPANWTIGENGNAATLNPSPEGLVSRVNTNGAVVEGYIDAKQMIETSGFNAVVVLAGPNQKQLDLRGGTFRVFKDSLRGYQELRSKLIARESAEQPGVQVLEACIAPDLAMRGWVNTRNLGSITDIVKRFGKDSYSINPANWFIAENGNLAVLRAPADGSITSINLNGAVVEGYFDALTPDRNINDAISFVAHPSQGSMASRGFSVRIFENADAGFNQLARQHLERERIEQPGVLPLFLGKCVAVEQPKIVVLPPTPEVVLPCAWPDTREIAVKTFVLNPDNDSYAGNYRNWNKIVDGAGNITAWHLPTNNMGKHWIRIPECYIAITSDYIWVNKVDPDQIRIINGKYEGLFDSVIILNIPAGQENANKIYNEYLDKHPRETLEVEGIGFKAIKDKSNQ